jgi:hypothetical protein
MSDNEMIWLQESREEEGRMHIQWGDYEVPLLINNALVANGLTSQQTQTPDPSDRKGGDMQAGESDHAEQKGMGERKDSSAYGKG